MSLASFVFFASMTAIRPAAPEVELYTMGPGDDLFSLYGHAAICIDERCYNFGTIIVQDAFSLAWSFLRGRAWFGVS